MAAPHEHITTCLNILNTFRAIDPAFPLQYAVCVCEIAQDEGLSLTHLSDKTGLSLSTVSRIVGALSQNRQMGKPYGLVQVTTSPKEKRRKVLALTDKGRTLMKDVVGVLG